MKLPIRFLSIPFAVMTITGMSACTNNMDAPPEQSLLKTGVTVGARTIEGSVVDWTKAVEQNLEFSKGYAAKGSMNYALGNQQGAIQDFTKAIELDPKSITAYSGRAAARFSAGDITGSVSDGFEAARLIVLSRLGNGTGAAE